MIYLQQLFYRTPWEWYDTSGAHSACGKGRHRHNFPGLRSAHLRAIQGMSTPSNASIVERNDDHLLILPDGRRVVLWSSEDNPPTIQVRLGDTMLCKFSPTGHAAVLAVSGVGTPYEHTATHVPHYPVLEALPSYSGVIGAPPNQPIEPADMWIAIYALFTRHHEQETIPIVISEAIDNHVDLSSYLLRSGLGRNSSSEGISQDILFLMRAAFWQGAGQIGYHELGWLSPHFAKHAPSVFPSVQSFTRTPLVITAHPLRPPKPEPGEVLYRRCCPSVGQVLEFTYFDPGTEDHCSVHLEAFHRWQNSERVSKFWNEQGSLVQHREYVMNVMGDPAILPIIMSWDGELMGYAEVVWVKVC